MKKLTSVVLSVLMVVSMLSCLFVGSASAEETGSTAPNLITNGDFESFDVNTITNANENYNCVPGFGWRSIKDILGKDKTNGQWYRTNTDITPDKAPDLDSNYKDVTKSKTTYPTYFGQNNQMVIEPTAGDQSENHVLRAVQDLNAQVELEDNGKYTLSFRFRLPNADTELKSFRLSFITPNQDTKKPILPSNEFHTPYVITNATIDTSGTDDGITIDSNNNITFTNSNAHENWKNVKVTFEVNRDNTVDFPVYTDSADNNKKYTFPVLMRIQFSEGKIIDLSGALDEQSTIAKKGRYHKACIYFDDFVMNKVVDCVGAAEFYNVNGEKFDNKNAYVGIKTQVNGKETNSLKLGDEVTATLEYNKDCNIFDGWYKNNGEFVQNDETLTFTVNDTDKYYPKFIDINLLRGAASFEGYDTPTIFTYVESDKVDGSFPPPKGDKWGTSYEGTYVKNDWFKLSTVTGSKDEPYYLEDHFNYDAENNINYEVSKTVSPRSGNSMLRINTHSRSAIRALTLTPNTDYTLSFYVYDTSDKDYISSVGIADRYKGYKPEAATSGTAGNIAVKHRKYTEGWQKVEISFNSGENTTLYLFIYQQAKTPYANQGASFVDDLVCYEVEHNFGEYVSDGNATCTEDGTKTATCTISGCGATDTVTDEGSKLGHSFTNYVSDGNATCTEDGTKTAVCDRDGCDVTDIITDKGSAGHIFTNYVSDGNATCTEDGTKTAVCDREDCTETKTVTDEGSKLGHSFTKYVSDGNATCTEDGTKTAVCDREDCNVTNTIADEGSKLGHSFTKYVSDKNATCTADGTKTAVCDRDGCNVTNTVKDVGTKLAHKYTNSCDATCNVCGATRTVGAHKYSNNCDTTCNICGAVRKITHSYKTYTTKATLTKNGSIVKKCSVCGVTASTTVIYYPKTVKIAATTYTYNGKVITPAVTVKNSKGTALKKGTDYTVTYASGRKNVGKYKVTVTFKGNYSGTKTFYFTINPVKTTVRKLTAGKKSIKVNITKKSTQVTGYQIQYSTSKTFKSAKTKTISSYKTTSTTLTKLTSKKTYYVRVRTYKTVGKTKYYSAWSTYKYTKAK